MNVSVLLGHKAHSCRMQTGNCNKCKAGRASEGDSWCLGCSSLEVSQQFLRKRWQHPGVRGIAEEATLACARYVRALYNLDCSLGSAGAGSRPLLLAAKSRAERPRSRSPPDSRPPLRRSHSVREQPRGGDHRREEKEERKDSEYSYGEESEEEEERERDDVKREDFELPREIKRTERPPEPPSPPRKEPTFEEKKTSKKKKKKKRKNHHRGGTRHQRHYREAEDPFRKSHRRLDSSRLELADSLRSGLERRA